jgi:ubiquinone/menaquinone biosynthesis C-methylase UbiE
MAHVDHLGSIHDLRGRAAVDIGAGDGTFSRQLDQVGASVSGIEIDPTMVARARVNLPDTVSMLVGRAEELPLEDGSKDIACFFFSFHHVPIDVQEQALEEVIRVLKPGGRLHIVEPYPFGSMFEVVRLVEDETRVRTHSHEVLGALGDRSEFTLIDKKDYVLTREYPDFETFLNKIVVNNPERAAVFPAVRDRMEKTFNRELDEVDGRRVLHQPCAAYHFEVPGRGGA